MDSVIQKINPNIWKTAATVSAAGILFKIAWTSLKSRKGRENVPEKWVNVAQVRKIIIYPVKSCEGVEVESAEVTPLGLKASKYLRDRAFLVVNSNGVFQTQRNHPTLALINVKIDGDNLRFSAPEIESETINMKTVEENALQTKSCRLWLDHMKAIDCGDGIAKWLNNFLKQDNLRLVYHVSTEGQRKFASSSIFGKFPNFTTRDLGMFHDDTAYLLMAEESIAVLNTKLESPVTYKSFRPVILIKGMREAFSEDFWKFIRFGNKESGPILKNCIPCARCRVTTVDQSKGVFDKDGQPLKTLLTMQREVGDKKTNELVKKSAILGNNLGLFEGNGSRINVGDEVYTAVI